jgi:hypothetical protein
MFREILRGRFFKSDSKTITVPLAAAPGVMKWATYGGVAYPKPTKASYAYGESVYIDFGWTNTGGTTANATITVVDTGTGATVWTYTMPSTAAGDTALAEGTKIGTMPNKTWNLRCDIAP